MATYVKRPQRPRGRGHSLLVKFIMDRSGSMASIQNDAIGGFNTYIKTLQDDKNNSYDFELTLFNTSSEIVGKLGPVSRMEPLNTRSYVPSGGTALNDAVADVIKATEPLACEYDKVLIVILTDGEENSSRRWNTAQVKELIEDKNAARNWTILFLGATSDQWTDRDVYRASKGYGVSGRNAVYYHGVSMCDAMANLGGQTVSYACSNDTATMDFFKGTKDLAAPQESSLPEKKARVIKKK